MSRSTGETGPTGVEGIRYDSQFSRIEELIKGNTFSGEQISHLVEVLNSRLEIEPEKNNTGVATEKVSWMLDIPCKLTADKQQDLDGTNFGTFSDRTDAPVGVGASPIDIARSYMASRTSERVYSRFNLTNKGEITHPSPGFPRGLPTESPLPKPSVFWPGAMVQNHPGYSTPQSMRGRSGIHDFPGTPYSRTILSKSTNKLQADSRGASPSTSIQPSQTFISGQGRSIDETVRGYGSVGPIRRIRNKFASEVRPRGSVFRNSSKEFLSDMVKPNVSGGFLLNTEKNLEPREGTSKQGSGDNSNINLSSSQAIKTISEHLDRKPTPKDREAELKIATSWRNASAPAEENNVDINFPVEFNKATQKSYISSIPLEKGKNKPEDAGNEKSKGSNSIFSDPSGPNAIPYFGIRGNSDTVVSNVHEDAVITANHGSKRASSHFRLPHMNNGLDVKSATSSSGSEPLKNPWMRPQLPSISVKKHDSRAVSSDNGLGFTFPVSTFGGGFSEPPTPSITPSSSISVVAQSQAMSTAPSYEFGLKRSAPRLVFSSLPSTSNTSIPEASDLKFKFGSEDKPRLSFSSFEKDAICY